MKEIPILFNAEMVRAILEGKKTQTRRPVKLPGIWSIDARDGKNWPGYEDKNGDWQWAVSPFGNVGDHLWVRESFHTDIRDPFNCVIYDATPELGKYRDTGEVVRSTFFDGKLPTREESRAAMLPKFWKCKHSIHMPRWASRITLKVTDIRVQRVQEISEEDAIAEGCSGSFSPAYCAGGEIVGADGEYPSDEFRKLWDSIYGTWDANPWVWVATFEVAK